MVRPKDPAALLNPTGPVEGSRPSSVQDMTFNERTIYSYQQISCLHSVVR